LEGYCLKRLHILIIFIFVYFANIILLLNICMTDITMDMSVCRSHNPVLLSSFIFINYRMFTITWFTWRLRLMEQELYALPEYLSSPPVLVWFLLLKLSIFCVVRCGPLFIVVLGPLHVLCVELLFLAHIWYCQEEIKDTKRVIRIRKSKKYRQHNVQRKKEKKGQTTIYKTYT
jgi:hypothetical protein